MSSAKSKAISEINLEEFERRLRAAGTPQAGVEDPLSELTRLVNTIASERPRGEKVVDIASARIPKSEPLPPAPQFQRETESSRAPNLESAPPASVVAPAPVAPPAPAAPPVSAPRPARVAPASIAVRPARVAPPTPVLARAPVIDESTPQLRASFEETFARAIEHGDSDAEALEAELQEAAAPSLEHSSTAPLQAGERISFARPPRRASWYLKVGGLTAIALLMVGGAASMKIGVPGLRKSPPLILAVDGPSRVAPPNEATVQSAGDTGALLLKDSAAPTLAPVKLVSTEEQPVDLLAQTPAPAPKPPAADGSSAPAPKLPAVDGQSAPAPKSPAADGQLAPAPNTPIVAPSEGPAAGPTLFPSAKRVKTVSVRPDGTLISADTAPDTPIAESPAPVPSPVAAAPTRKLENVGAAALAATPTIDLPAKPAPKSSARVNIAKTETSADSANAPLQLGSITRAVKPAKTPKPKPAAVVADATPAAAETDTTPTFETASAGGGWAVQLAAPRSESEAQGAIARFQNKYGDQLGSSPLAVHKAEVNGETIYRVRAGGLSKAQAHTLCSKLKASGGDCFVARNN